METIQRGSTRCHRTDTHCLQRCWAEICCVDYWCVSMEKKRSLRSAEPLVSAETVTVAVERDPAHLLPLCLVVWPTHNWTINTHRKGSCKVPNQFQSCACSTAEKYSNSNRWKPCIAWNNNKAEVLIDGFWLRAVYIISMYYFSWLWDVSYKPDYVVVLQVWLTAKTRKKVGTMITYGAKCLSGTSSLDPLFR